MESESGYSLFLVIYLRKRREIPIPDCKLNFPRCAIDENPFVAKIHICHSDSIMKVYLLRPLTVIMVLEQMPPEIDFNASTAKPFKNGICT